STLSYFSEFIEPFQKQNRQIRTWAHVEWEDQKDILPKLIHHEHASDHLLKGTGLICVCAYNGDKITANLLTSLMSHHEFFMTD
ncbi:MEDS domain-containing protein, partial [Pseudomonas sp. 2822-17]|uniref:MEDS domain-containing protein n=1 Tax=Pseudomonas sp. 2822-17 TaxID=1712678 RepID=UPI0015B310C2